MSSLPSGLFPSKSEGVEVLAPKDQYPCVGHGGCYAGLFGGPQLSTRPSESPQSLLTWQGSKLSPTPLAVQVSFVVNIQSRRWLSHV